MIQYFDFACRRFVSGGGFLLVDSTGGMSSPLFSSLPFSSPSPSLTPLLPSHVQILNVLTIKVVLILMMYFGKRWSLILFVCRGSQEQQAQPRPEDAAPSQ
ncbi:hypothetical protein ACLB2K_002359 [Fragaria x ananassa]